MPLRVAILAALRTLKSDAGWRRLSVLGLASTMLALTSDFLRLNAWLIPATTIAALIVTLAAGLLYLRCRDGRTATNPRTPARTVLVAAMMSLAFGSIWAGQATIAPGSTLTGDFMRSALEMQDSLTRIEDRMGRVDEEVGRVRTLMEEDAAREALRRAQEAQDYADYGQIAALPSLAATGISLDRVAVSGMDLRGLVLPEQSLAEARGSFVWLDEANLAGANLSGAGLIGAGLERADLSRATLDGAMLLLSRSADARFDAASAADAIFSAADLRGASFAGADLRRAQFAFADLSGADFSGADLTDAVLIGATVADTDFAGALFHNTDITGLRGDPVLAEAQQQGLCRTGTETSQSVNVLLIERIPSSQFSGGVEYNRMFEEWFSYQPSAPAGTPACSGRDFADEWSFPIWRKNGTDILSASFTVSFSQEFLGKGGRRQELVRRVREQLIARAISAQ